MKNTLEDLNNHLFIQLERLTDFDTENVDETKLKLEIEKATAISDIAGKIIASTNTTLEALKLVGADKIPTLPNTIKKLPITIGVKDGD